MPRTVPQTHVRLRIAQKKLATHESPITRLRMITQNPSWLLSKEIQTALLRDGLTNKNRRQRALVIHLARIARNSPDRRIQQSANNLLSKICKDNDARIIDWTLEAL